ncbi:MAG: hypothetical protein K0U47_11695 [Epsilonproteobacteria bacterium]|nr:hypothetical protein [Campylobacterota bacterium]
MKNTPLFIIIALLLTSCSLSSQEAKELPFHHDFSTPKGWSLGAGAKYDATQKAIKFSQSGNSWVTTDRLVSEFTLPIQANRTYTLSFKSKTDTWPPPSLEVYGAYYGQNGEIANSLGTMTANSQTNTWEESTVYIDVPNNQAITAFKIKILNLPKRGKDGNIWIDDISFKEGFHTSKNQPAKKSFNGSITKIDTLGNIEILKNGKFEPFFPLGIYTDHKRVDWSIYQKQGFNIAMWADGAGAIKKAKEVGLYSSMQIVQYIMPSDPDWIPQEEHRKLVHLDKRLKEIKNQGLEKNLLFYYIDNEFYHIKEAYTKITDRVIAQDFDQNGQRMHPIYMLSGTYGLARKYNKRVDFTGTYAAEDHHESDRTNAFVTLNETENQTQPAIIAQLNRGVNNNFRPILFGAIAKGARGAAYWRDGGSVGDIAKRAWWSDLPKISQEIKQMMPLIRADHKTQWHAQSDHDKIIAGTRTVDNTCYMILANPTRKEIKTTFKLQNMPYETKSVIDYFTKVNIVKVVSNTITIILPPQSSKVITLVK